MTSKSHDNEVADDLISEAGLRVRREALRRIAASDIDDDEARMENVPEADPGGSASPSGGAL